MQQVDRGSEHFDWIETALPAGHLDLPNLALAGQTHYGPPDCLAYVIVFGVDADQARCRQVRSEANDLLRCLGYAVEITPERDVYDLEPVRSASSQERLRMLQNLRVTCDSGG